MPFTNRNINSRKKGFVEKYPKDYVPTSPIIQIKLPSIAKVILQILRKEFQILFKKWESRFMKVNKNLKICSV